MISFLDSIAKAYLNNFDELESFCFVFPNKRAGTFFLKSLNECAGSKTLLAPEILSVSEFMERLSGVTAASKIDLVFRLFNIYRETYLKKTDDKMIELLQFDKFRHWGEIVLKDFSEVDQYLVDASEIFQNVGDYHEIATDFLTEEQREIISKYFGYQPSASEPNRFWKNFRKSGKSYEVKDRFATLWGNLVPLYKKLTESLDSAGLATEGGVYRKAKEKVASMIENGESPEWKKIVFVGFNALSTAEAATFELLRKMSRDTFGSLESQVDFYWDATGPVAASDKSDAYFFLRCNMRNLPSPGWAKKYLDESRNESMPGIMKSISSPSNSAQAKIAGMEISRIPDDEIEKTAVVLPDESLLLPLLHSLPELKDVNLTMGFPLKQTSTATFMYHLRKIFVRAKNVGGKVMFFRDDLLPFISHPFIHLLTGSAKANEQKTRLTQYRFSRIPFETLETMAPESSTVLNLDISITDSSLIINYIVSLLDRVAEVMDGNLPSTIKRSIDKANIQVYREALMTLKAASEEHGVSLGLAGVFYMIDKLISSEKVIFEGKPLKGLQVMGLLETRAIDFENLIILSLNDRVLPRKSRRSTFIPEALRRGYGLPSSNYQERLFAYYFYRMLSRAESVTMIHDGRSGEGMRSGGKSRYLLQLEYLYARGLMKEIHYRFKLNQNSPSPKAIVKTDSVMDEIRKFSIEGSNANFSASALKKYGVCQVKFYYESIAKIKTDPEPSNYIDPITQGNIVHDTMLYLYLPHPGLRYKFLKDRIVITEDFIDNLLNSPGKITAALKKAVLKNFYKTDVDSESLLEGTSELVLPHLEEQIKGILKYDRSLTPFEFAGGEITGLYRWMYEPGKFVNMKYAIDRLDRVNLGSSPKWRIVDYKTGGADVEAADFEDIFSGKKEAKNIFQLLLYANLLNRHILHPDNDESEDVRVSIYQVDNIVSKGENIPKLPVNGEKNKSVLSDHMAVNDRFVEYLNSIISEIFNKDIPFAPTSDPDHCEYCSLKQLCGR